MGIWRWLFGSDRGGDQQEGQRSQTLVVPNRWSLGNGGSFVVEAEPNLERIFSDPDPSCCQEATEGQDDFWATQDLASKRSLLACAYLQHPDPRVILATIPIVEGERAFAIDQVLVDLLAWPYDFEGRIARSAARALWQRHRKTNCKFPVHALRDELQGPVGPLGGIRTFPNKETVIRALDILVAEAPDPAARKAIEARIESDVIIEERIPNVDISSVEFVGKERRGGCTYEVWRAESRAQAKSFLKAKVVTEKLYYIEVETPEGNIGRDIEGVYLL